MSKKTLNVESVTNELKGNSAFFPSKPAQDQPAEVTPEVVLETTKPTTPKVVEIRHTLPLPESLLDDLKNLTRLINRRRSPKARKMRITTNTIIRAWLSTL